MEFVIVKYPESRDVIIDEQVAGKTGETLQIESGYHRFSLGVPLNYSPPERVVGVSDTNPSMPMKIPFTPMHGA